MMKPVIIIAIAFVLLIPVNAFAIVDTMIRFDSIHSQYDVGEKMTITVKNRL